MLVVKFMQAFASQPWSFDNDWSGQLCGRQPQVLCAWQAVLDLSGSGIIKMHGYEQSEIPQPRDVGGTEYDAKCALSKNC
jgi:hypothetical protein